MSINFDSQTTKIINRLWDSFSPYRFNDDLPGSLIPGSANVAGIELRMLPPFIRNNRTPRFLFFPGNAKLYCLTMVISDAANQLSGAMDLSAFHGVGDSEFLPVNKTIFYWEKKTAENLAPNQVHVVSSIIKSKGALRETGDILSRVKDDSEYQNLIGTLGTIVADTASFSMVTNISLDVARIVGRYMGKVDDQPIGTAINSFTRLHGDWDQLGINPVHITTKNVDFSYELIIRDNERFVGETRKSLPETQQPLSTTLHHMMPM